MKGELSLNLNDYVWKILRRKLLSSLENKCKGFNSSNQSLDEKILKILNFQTVREIKLLPILEAGKRNWKGASPQTWWLSLSTVAIQLSWYKDSKTQFEYTPYNEDFFFSDDTSATKFLWKSLYVQLFIYFYRNFCRENIGGDKQPTYNATKDKTT